MRVALWAGFDRFTGYGNDAVDIALNLERQGVDVIPWPTQVLPGLPPEFVKLLTKDPSVKREKYDVMLAFQPPFDLKPFEFATLGDVAIGWTMWERTPLLRTDMDNHGWRHPYKRRQFWGEPLHNPKVKEHLDLMLVTCDMNVEAFQNVDPHVPYRVLPCGIEPDDWPVMEHGADDGVFRFGMIGMLAGRKDPWVMLQAWRELKEEYPEFDAQLEMKTACPGLDMVEHIYGEYGVTVHQGAWPREKIVDWYKRINVLVSTSRGEGNNKPGMEFMATGGPVIASDWSGHQNWNSNEWGWPVRGKLVETPATKTFDFRIDKEHLKESIYQAWSRRELTLEKGVLAHQVARKHLSWHSVTERLIGIMEEVHNGYRAEASAGSGGPVPRESVAEVL